MTEFFNNVIADRFFLILGFVSAFMVAVIALGCGFTIGPDGNEYFAAAFQLFNPHKFGNSSEYIGLYYSVFFVYYLQ